MAKLFVFEVAQISELSTVVDFLSDYLKPNTLFLFDGPMASGKTTLISEVLKKMNVQHVHSPTYALHHLYLANPFRIHHFDLHRLTSDEDIESSGFWDFFEFTNDLFFVEWAKVISIDQWPLNFKIIQVEILNGKDRIRQFRISI